MWLSPRGLGQFVFDRVVFVKTGLAQGSREEVCVLFVLFSRTTHGQPPSRGTNLIVPDGALEP